MTWTANPQAAMLLASCAAHPPVYERCERVYAGRSREEWLSTDDARIERLELMRWDWCVAQVEHLSGRERMAAFRQVFDDQPTVSAAIVAASQREAA